FLGHIERCRVLLHLVDATGDNPVENYRIVRGELDAYGAGLIDKPEVIALNKIDALDPAEVKKLATKLKRASKGEVMLLSGAAGTGLEAVLDRLVDVIGPAEAAPAMPEAEADEEPGEWSPI
ncbi:MAG: GTPase ObgE, partial [Sphingomonas sp.]|nr:GTPase ObgE [Sphingomonas sp.]